MDSEKVEEKFYTLIELYATLKTDIKYLVTHRDLAMHSDNCEARKKHKILIWVGAMLSGSSFLVGLLLQQVFF